MIKKLSIQNYALIDQIDIEFDEGLNIMTGETGAGKSIILGALGLVMGKRADLKALYNPEKNCLVEALINIAEYKLDTVLNNHDIERDTELVIRRVISKSGKSRAFINDLPVSLKSLQDIAGHLIQMHNQFDNLDLGDPNYQLKMVDALAGNQSTLNEYKALFREWNKEISELQRLQEKIADFEKEKDFILFQYNELAEIDLESALEEDIEDTLELLSNAEAITQAMQTAYFELSENENSIIDKLNLLSRQLEQLGQGAQVVEKLTQQFHELIEGMQNLSNDLYSGSEKIEFDPGKIAELQAKQDGINRLLHKHHLKELKELLALKASLEEKLSLEMEAGEQMAEKEKRIAGLESNLLKLAKQLRMKRKEAAKDFCTKAEKQLRDLAMPHAQMTAQFGEEETLTSNGTDAFELLFSANKGSKPESIKNVASGGELSRLSLSVKSIIAGHMALPTLIFDEIEAGISGEIALKMGKILKALSTRHQVINITHSAQIASRGDMHLFVYKSDKQNRTVTRIKTLEKQEKITEIAKMLSGDPPTPTAIKNAEELIHLN